MSTYIAIIASIMMLATNAALGRDRAAVLTGVDQTAVYGTPADNGIQATWAAQYRMDQQTPGAVQTSATPSAGVTLIAARGGGGGSMHGGMGSFHGGASSSRGGMGSFHGGASSSRGGMGSFHGGASSSRGGMGSFHGGTSSFRGGVGSFRGGTSSFHGGFHRDFDRGFHRDFDDFHGHHNFHHRDNDFFFGLGFGYYPYSCYPYGYYNSPYSGYYCGNPWYFYPYLSFSW